MWDESWGLGVRGEETQDPLDTLKNACLRSKNKGKFDKINTLIFAKGPLFENCFLVSLWK